MPQLVKDENLVENDGWQCLDAEQCSGTIQAERFLPLNVFLEATPSNLPEQIGVWLTAEDDIETLAPELDRVKKIACRVDNFMDGRNFSQARVLREQLGFTGGIRAVGGFIQDQLFYLKRCGFDEFQFDTDVNLESVRESLNDFSDAYQAACDVSEPLFRRRSL